MNATPSIYDRLSKRVAPHWFGAARLLWLLLAVASFVIFARGVPIFVEELRWTYSANLGFSLQQTQANELILIPDEGTQAARAGVMERDVLVAVDGEPVSGDDAAALVRFLAEGAAGTAVTLQIRTGERPLREITLIRGDRAGAWLNHFHLPVAAVVAVAVGVELLVTLSFIAVATFIFWRGGQTPIVWLSSLVLILVFAGGGSLPVQSLYFAELDWQYGLDVWFSLMVVALLLFLFLFPSGRFVPRWAALILPFSLFWVAAAWFWPDLYFWRLDSQPYLLILIVILLASVAAQLWRYRFVSSPQQRQQTKWVVWGIGAALTALLFQFAAALLLPESPPLFDLLINPLARLTQLVIPVTVAFAIFQHRLWQIDVIVNRTLVYGGLTVLITAVYALLVGGFGTLAANQSEQLISLLLVITVIVFSFRPLRSRWQTAVNRFIPLPDPPPLPQTATPSQSVSDKIDAAKPLHGSKRRLTWFSLSLAIVLTLALLIISTLYTNLSLNQAVFFLITPAYVTVGTMIILRHPQNRIAHLCLLIGWLWLPTQIGLYQEAFSAILSQLTTLTPLLIQFSQSGGQVVCLLIFVYLPLLFPDGQYLSAGWRGFGRGLALLIAIPIMLTLIKSGPIYDWANGAGALAIQNPFGIHWPWLTNLPFEPLIYAWGIPTMLATFAAIVSLGLRWRQSDRTARQQIKWVVYFLSTLVALFMLLELMFWLFDPFMRNTAVYPFIEFAYGSLAAIVWVGFPLIIGLAILKYRLYDIDIIINRTLVYGGLSLGTVAVYVLVVGALGTLFQAQGNFLFALLATGFIAVLFQPVRERLQRGVNRLMFGERDEPYAVLSKLGARLQTATTPGAMLQSVVETVATTLKLPYAAIELADEQGRLKGTAVGTAVAETAEFPLRYQNENVGYLVVSPRSPGELFTEREQQLLADIAGQTGAMAYAVRLTIALQRSAAALQQSREKLVLAREEERRRIRRDLHDELGPTLASQTFALDAALEALEHDPQTAAQLLQALKTQNQATVADIRRLVYELRPPTLDELGIMGALQVYVAKLDGRSHPHIQLTADPDPLPPLSAAVEVAAYRIALEAITNVVRHAQAQRCHVCLQVKHNGRTAIQIEVSDDGIGLPSDRQPGVGLNSMRERAEELGGSLTVVNEGEGVRVTAVLPM